MAGTQTHGFDMVIELSSTTIQQILSATFDSDGLLGSLLPGSLGVLESFGLTSSFNRPPDIPAGAVNPVQLMFELNFAGGIGANLEIVVGMGVDRTELDWDKIILDLVNNIYKCELTVQGISNSILSNFVKNAFDNVNLPLIPVPVDRTSSGTMHITRADVKVIDSASGADALAVTMTFGGGAVGNINDFTEAFSREGAGAAVAINFAWICRNISPKIEEALELPAGSFTNCGFNGNHEIRDGVHLKSLSISAQDDHLRLSGSVSKSGTCYEATGTFTARISVAIVNGELRVSFETDDPDLDIDVPWYCWLGAVVLGAIVGGAIFGVVGAIAGGIIVPLILLIAETVVESTVESVTSQVSDSINNIEDINVQLVGIDTILDAAFIDDMTITYDLYPQEYWPVKSEGVIFLPNGNYLDIDNGVVKTTSFSGADMKLEGSDQGRRLKVLCGSSVAELNTGKSFQHIRRFDLLMLSYGIVNPLPLQFFAIYFPIPFMSDEYFETHRTFAIKTSDGSYGFFTVLDVRDNGFNVKYKVYKSNIYNIDFTGGFNCIPKERLGAKLKPEKVDYVSSNHLNIKLRENLKQFEGFNKGLVLPAPKGGEPIEVMINSVRPVTEFTDAHKNFLLKYNRGVGNWIGQYALTGPVRTAVLKPKISGNVPVAEILWFVDGALLKNDTSGKIQVKGQEFEYSVKENVVTLSSKTTMQLDVPVKLLVSFEDGLSDYIIKCLVYKKACKFSKRVIPTFREYASVFEMEFGTSMMSKARLIKQEPRII